MNLKPTKLFNLLLQELSHSDRYQTHTVYDYFIKNSYNEEKVNVILRMDVDHGLCLVEPIAELLKERGINASIYYLTHPQRYYDIWSSQTPAITAKMGFEVGLHTDHYYEECIGLGAAIPRIKEDISRLSSAIGQDVRGMVWHGHQGVEKLGICNWQPYKFMQPNELNLAYHDGFYSPYTNMETLGRWLPNTDFCVSDFFLVPGGNLYLPHRFVQALRQARPGQSVSILFHPENFFENWEEIWVEDNLEKKLEKPPFRLKTYLKIKLRPIYYTLRSLTKFVLKSPIYLVPIAHKIYQRPTTEMFDFSKEYELNSVYEQKIDDYESNLKNWNLIPAESALEVGFGAGQWLIALGRNCKKVWGVEPQNLRVRLTLDKLKEYSCKNVYIEQAFAEKLPFEDESFDLLFCYGVLMYSRPKQAMKEFRRVLKPGGKLFISAQGMGYHLRHLRDGIAFNQPNLFLLGWYAILNTLGMRYLLGRDTVGGSFFSFDEMRKLFKEYGFEVTELELESTRWGSTYAGQPVFFRCIGYKS